MRPQSSATVYLEQLVARRRQSPEGRVLRRRVRALALTAVMVSAVLGASAGSALAVEYPATWAISGNTAVGTTPSGVVVTATVTGPATLIPPSGSLVFTGSTPSYFPTTTTQALHLLISSCGGPSCGSITYSFSQPVVSPVLYTGDIGSGSVNSGVFTEYHDSPITLAAGTFSLVSVGSQTANMSLQNSGTTIGITDPAAEIGTSLGTQSSCGTFGCGAYAIATPTSTVTSVTMNFGYAGTGTSGDVFSMLLGTKVLQTISGLAASPSNPTYSSGGTFTVSATASSGLQVAFSTSTSSICTVGSSSGTSPSTATVTMLSAGTCTIAADQPGNSTYTAAPQVTLGAPLVLSVPALSPWMLLLLAVLLSVLGFVVVARERRYR